MSDVLMAERYRYNQHVLEQWRLGFPWIRHYDTWLIDYLQIIVERNHRVLLYLTGLMQATTQQHMSILER